MHNGNVIPTKDAYYGVSSAYQAGTSVFDFTGVTRRPEIFLPFEEPSQLEPPPVVAEEVAFFDAKNDPPPPTGIDDAWSSYWHNDYVYVSSGLPSPPPAQGAECCVRPGNRGLDVYLLLGRGSRLTPVVTNPRASGVQQYRAKKFRYQNPQTQERFQSGLVRSG